MSLSPRITTLFGLFLWPQLATAQYPGMGSASWVSEQHDQSCAISQNLPGNKGLVKFQRLAGKRLELTVSEHTLVSADSETGIYAAPPLWRHDQGMIHLGNTQRIRGNQPFQVSADIAEQMLTHLAQGNATIFSYSGQDSTADAGILTLSPTFFAPALADFQNCIKKLRPFDPKKLDLVEVNFDYGGATLDQRAKNRLDGLVKRLSHQGAIKALKITGFTDSGGHAYQNMEMARMRALSVENHLIAAGIDPEKLQFGYLGQSSPRYSNQTPAGRAANRRVEIQILR